MGNKQGVARKAKAGGGAPAGGAGGGEEEKEGGIDYDLKASKGGQVTIDDFDLLKVLGKGSFGKVMLVKKKQNQRLYAMKTLRKAALIKRKQLVHTSTERQILQHMEHPFLTALEFAFQTQEKLYLVMPYMGGGELFFWLKKHRRFSLARAKLYTAEMVLALGALHQYDIVYRDMKPENVLLDAEGHIRITDFGLAKGEVTGMGAKGGTTTFCGTPEYLAPEILENKGHGKAVDWWALGTLLYEMVHGLPPFYDQNQQRMYDKILHADLRFPSSFTTDLRRLISGWLTRPVRERLGSERDGLERIKSEPFFGDLDWDMVLSKRYSPEFVPPCRNATDVGNFDAEFTVERPVDSVVVQQLSETAQEKTRFEGFTYDGGGAM